MALFSKSKKAAPKSDKSEKAEKAVVKVAAPAVAHFKDVLRMPRITEKASALAMKNIVVFNVSDDATKRDIIAAVKKSYKVTPTSVRIISVPQKTVRHMKTGRMGVKGGGKKAYVYLKDGDSMTLA
jgi:large subunit ribosomal protein L23